MNKRNNEEKRPIHIIVNVIGQRKCGVCGRLNLPGGKYCGKCGSSLNIANSRIGYDYKPPDDVTKWLERRKAYRLFIRSSKSCS